MTDGASTLSSQVHTGQGALPEFHVQLLGRFHVTVGEQALPESAWKLRKAALLIKVLALAPRFQLHREQVLELLWPDLDPQAAANNLHYTLHVARRLLGLLPDGYLCLRAQVLTLGPPDRVDVDAQRFEELAERALQTGSIPDARSALAVYEGELLPEDRYEDWAAQPRERLAVLRLSLLRRVAQEAARDGDPATAIRALQQAIAVEPILEEAHAELMQLYASLGQRQQAIRQFERLRDILRQELNMEPDGATIEIRDRILSGAVPSQPQPPALTVQESRRPRHNLRAELTSFVGRIAETDRVCDLLRTERLVTLIGAGGGGKTRLALHAARELLDDFRDGVWLVELAGVSESEAVHAAVAECLALEDQEGLSVVDALAGALETRALLLVLDNCEHVIDAVAHFTERLLTSCPELHVLATSREPLGVSGESVVVVPPLPVPQAQLTIQDLIRVDAVRLLVDRIRYRQPDFQVTKDNAHAIISICDRLGGIPLALELAASRTGSLSLDQIRDHLSDALDLLTTGGRTVDPRQRTLRGALDWSYDLLSAPERELFMRLSVFRGGFTLHAAAAISGAADSTELQVLDLLSRLVDKSLIVAGPIVGGEIRYYLLEPIRQYAAELLQRLDQTEAMRARHASLFLALAERAHAELRGPAQVEWLQTLEREHDNLRAALAWSRDSGASRVGLRLTAALWLFWYVRGHVREGERWLATALAGHTECTRERAEALRGRGALAYKQRLHEQAIAAFEEAVTLFRELGEDAGVGACLANLATALQDSGDLDRALVLHQEALATRRKAGDDVGVASTLSNIGVLYYLKVDYEHAAPLLEESLRLYRNLGDTGSVAIGLNNLGELALKRNRHESAADFFQESLSVAHTVGETEIVASCLEGLSSIAYAEANLERAALLSGGAEALRQEIHSPLRAQEQKEHMARLAEMRRALGDRRLDSLLADAGRRSLADIVRFALEESPPLASQQADEAHGLSTRERDVAMLVMQGMTNRAIADRLQIGERTVETHIRRALKKLGLVSRAQLAAWVAAEGLGSA